jgi:hypothetical protein
MNGTVKQANLMEAIRRADTIVLINSLVLSVRKLSPADKFCIAGTGQQAI